MKLEIHQADFDDPVHRAGIVEVLDSYASDPVGGGEPLSSEVRQRLVPALRYHPSGISEPLPPAASAAPDTPLNGETQGSRLAA